MSDVSNKQLKDLLLATARGDAGAFRELYDETSPRLFGVALTMLRDPGHAEDVLQEAFVQVWHRAGDYHAERGSVFTWLTTIVRYRAIDLLRKRDPTSGRAGPVGIDPDDFDYLRLAAAEGDGNEAQPGPLARAIASEENSRLRDCIERLSGNQQRSVSLAFFRGLTHRELADCLAEPLGTIKSRLRRSLMRLKECLEQLGNADEIRRGAS